MGAHPSALSTPEPEAPWRAGLRGARANLLPGLALQAIALALGLAYYFHPPTHEMLNRLAVWRAETGVGSAILMTGLAGGVLPGLYLLLHPAHRGQLRPAQALWLALFWSYKGLEIELWYRVLAWGVGEGVDAGTVAAKMLLDQFVYCPLLAVPLTWFAYAWGDAGFRVRPVLVRFGPRGWYFREVLPMLLSNLGVWVPAVLIIFALPTPLQLPLQNLVLCFFTLLLAHLTREQRTATQR